jgi:hypothetical protein
MGVILIVKSIMNRFINITCGPKLNKQEIAYSTNYEKNNKWSTLI